MRTLALALAGMLAVGTAQAESALTSRATDLMEGAQSDSATLARLPENTRVDVLGRKGAWSQVKAGGGQTGWIRMMSLKPEAGAQQGAPAAANPLGAPAAANPLGALGTLLTSGRAANTATVTTGVRGLSEEDLQNAHANPADVERMQKFRVGKDAAQAFAQRSMLTPNKVDYLPDPVPVQGSDRNAEGG